MRDWVLIWHLDILEVDAGWVMSDEIGLAVMQSGSNAP